MENKKINYTHLIITILLTMFIMYLFWENDAIKLKEEISFQNEIIEELKFEIEEKNSQIQSLQEQYQNIESSINVLYDELTPRSDLEGQEVKIDIE